MNWQLFTGQCIYKPVSHRHLNDRALQTYNCQANVRFITKQKVQKYFETFYEMKQGKIDGKQHQFGIPRKIEGNTLI